MELHISQLQRSSKPKSITELLKEIAMLEMEVLHLEKYLVSLYQKALDRRISAVCKDSKDIIPSEQKRVSSDRFQMPPCHAINNNSCSEEYSNEASEQDVLGCSIHRSHSSLSQHSAYASQLSPLAGKVSEAVNSYHSLPLTLLEHDECEASNGAIHNASEVKETANLLSEEMVKCISAIYCEMAANSEICNNFPSPVVSFPSSMSGSPRVESNLWSPQPKINYLQNLNSEFSGPYCQMVEVLRIHRDSIKLKETEPMVNKFRSLISKLEDVNPGKLNHNEKLAFWINVHNSLVMHAFLVYGVPQNKLKRVSLLLKSAYSIGGHTISVSMIQDYILRIPLPNPGQWFHRLLHLKKKFRTGDKRRQFAIDQSEPLSYFALCCGSHSDPPIRVYTPQTVFEDLIAARDQYVLSNYHVHKEQNKILLPKILENYAKDSGFSPTDFMKILELILPADLQRNRTISYNFWHNKKSWKGIEWISHDFSFRYQFPKDQFMSCSSE